MKIKRESSRRRKVISAKSQKVNTRNKRNGGYLGL